ncbi:hypothetical protein CLAFUW4_07723 [Fulvia fulva]|nr:hypothetical protein CLAFUR4_07728 [Fulvia fulva]WPV12051.1 hypothetical protein CLAFUW4_07723 [Fulvia fulva]
MDVRAWLQNTADREPPDEEDRAGFPDYLRPDRYTAEGHTLVHQSKRKRASSEPHSAQKRPSRGRRGGQARPAAPDSSPGHGPEPRTDTASSSSSSREERRESSPDRRFNRTFERRARHKTKEDRYEPKAKKWRKEHESRKDHKSKSKSKRRQSHRSGDGARTAGLVTSFQLKDRPKNNRLTLRPADVSAGIFKHGRAGAPVVGKGSGLPDLVFNEMRFLRRPREHQDEIPVDQTTKDCSGKADKQPGQNISAYFAKPPPEAPRSRQQQQTVPALDRIPHQRSQEVEKAADEVPRRQERRNEAAGNLPPDPFLGFGSRGPNQEVSNGIRRSGSCYTCSESVPPAKEDAVQTRIPMAESARHPADQDDFRRPYSPKHVDGNPRSSARRRPPSALRGRWVHSKRAPGSASVDVYQQAVCTQNVHRGDGLPARKQSSMSLPHSVPEPPLESAYSANRRHATGNCPRSDILRIGDDHQDDIGRPALHHQDMFSDIISGKENQEPSTSTPTSKLLRRAFHAITGPQAIKPSNTHGGGQGELQRPDRSPYLAQPSDGALYQKRHMDAEYEQELDQRRKQQICSMPERGFSRLTETSRPKQQQSMARPTTLTGNVMPTTTLLSRAFHEISTRCEVAPDAEMLDNVPTYQPVPLGRQYTFTNSRQAEDLVRRLTSNQQTNHFASREAGTGDIVTRQDHFSHQEADSDGVAHLRTNSEVAHLSTGHLYSQVWSNNDATDTTPDPGGGEVQHDSMPGFWKPNRLY